MSLHADRFLKFIVTFIAGCAVFVLLAPREDVSYLVAMVLAGLLIGFFFQQPWLVTTAALILGSLLMANLVKADDDSVWGTWYFALPPVAFWVSAAAAFGRLTGSIFLRRSFGASRY